MYGSEILLQENPRRRRRKARRRNPTKGIVRNPIATQNIRDFYQGVSPSDAMFAVGGLAGTTVLPGMVVRNTASRTNKVIKGAVALGTAGVMGLAARALTNDKGNAQAAVIGGMSGALAQIIGAWSGVQIGGKSLIGGGKRKVGNARVVSPGVRRESETVSLITP